MNEVYVGFDPRERRAVDVAIASMLLKTQTSCFSHQLKLHELRDLGMYWRPTEIREGKLWDVISDHWMSTEFAISRFLVPVLAGSGLAMFVDCDVLFRKDVEGAFAQARRDPGRAVYCVKHDYVPAEKVKMDGQVQTNYSRKNWSSVMIFDCDHPSNKKLTVELVNLAPGRDLHAFCWLANDEIGELSRDWNYLVGESQHQDDPSIAHFTNGTPDMAGHECDQFADEWREKL